LKGREESRGRSELRAHLLSFLVRSFSHRWSSSNVASSAQTFESSFPRDWTWRAIERSKFLRSLPTNSWSGRLGTGELPLSHILSFSLSSSSSSIDRRYLLTHTVISPSAVTISSTSGRSISLALLLLQPIPPPSSFPNSSGDPFEWSTSLEN